VYDLDAKLPAHLAARLVGVSRQLVHYWHTAGHLTPVAVSGRQPLYRLGDLLAVERDMRNSPHSHRRHHASTPMP
jgi:predicted site-specific integrase-resolvase